MRESMKDFPKAKQAKMSLFMPHIAIVGQCGLYIYCEVLSPALQ